jgi:CHAT domain-containing protein/Tfp pilus assembly protein PilF
MSTAQFERRLQAGGTLNPRQHIYIERPQDAELLRLLLAGEYSNVLTPRQMGKSSLMARTSLELAARGVRFSAIDIAGELGTPPEAESWYLGLLTKLTRDLKLDLDVQAWWDSLATETKNQRLLRFFREEVAGCIESPIVIFLDEIDITLKLPYTDDLFTALRTMYNERPFVPAYEKVTVCLLGVATPNELIKHSRTTPYNIGRTLLLREFNEVQNDLSPLAQALNSDSDVGRAILHRILYWTNGHPYLTMKLCEELAYSGACEPNDIDAHVDRTFIHLDQLGTDVHFHYIIRFLTTRLSDQISTFRVYERILSGVRERDHPDLTHIQLKLSGLVMRNEEGCLVVSNRLYERLFDARWIARARPKPRLQWAPMATSVGFLVFLFATLLSLLSLLETHVLVLDRPLERELAPGKVDTFVVPLKANQYLQLLVEQKGVDVIGSLFNPRGRKLIEVDNPTGSTGTERIMALADIPGQYRLELRTSNGVRNPGRYKISIHERRVATTIDRQRVTATRELAAGHDLRRNRSKRSVQEALQHYESALRLFQMLGDFSGQTDALYGLSLAYQSLGQTRQALQIYRRALPLAGQEASTYLRLGELLFASGDLQEAISHLQRARRLSLQLGNPRQAAVSSRLIGDVYSLLGDVQQALRFYDRSLEEWREVADPSGEALTFQRRGELFLSIGKLAQASNDLAHALVFYRGTQDYRSQATTFNALGEAYHRLGRQESALLYFRQALEASKLAGSTRDEIEALLSLGATYEANDHPGEALNIFERVLVLSRDVGNRRAEARALTNLGAVHNSLGRPREALEVYRRAVLQWRSIKDLLGEGDALLGMAKAERQRDNLLTAQNLSEDALRLVDTSHTKASSRDLRPYFEFYIDLLMDLHRNNPSGGYDARALETADRARARSFLDTFDEVGIADDSLTLREIQTSVLDKDTLLLEYTLGEERSFLWAVTTNSIHSFQLPGRIEIEDTAQRAYMALSSYQRQVPSRIDPALTRLSQMLLSPATDLMGSRRLFIVSEGVLDLIPFGALPLPPSSSSQVGPLILQHEIVAMPSASSQRTLRRKLMGRPPAPGALAVIANPLLKDRHLSHPFGQFIDLEARSILALAPADQTFFATGSFADRETVFSGNLARYRIIHFATNGVLNTREFSGLVLSQLDENGNPQDGYLRTHEIYSLNLPAELVVLSGCQTGLGKEVDGERLTTMARGFMYAGSKRVVASLWDIHDEATAELMFRFYREMFQHHRRPAEALRLAQIAMLKEPRWRNPYYWAGFVFQGEWE